MQFYRNKLEMETHIWLLGLNNWPSEKKVPRLLRMRSLWKKITCRGYQQKDHGKDQYFMTMSKVENNYPKSVQGGLSDGH